MTDNLPDGWVLRSLGDLTAKKVDQRSPGDQPVRYIDISSIDRVAKRIGETSDVTASDAPTRARQWVCPGDVLVSMTRPNLNAVAIVDSRFDQAVASTGFDVLRADGVLPKWIFYRVRSSEFISDICRDLQGVVYPAVRPKDVRRHLVPVPPLEEQEAIVAALDSYFSRLDDAVANLERVQRNLKRYRASVLKAAVEGRLVPTEAELARAEGRDYEPASVLLERILAERRRRWEEAELEKMLAKGKPPKNDKWKAKYQEPAEPDLDGLPELPEGWCWATVGAIADAVNGRAFKSSEWKSAGTPIIRIQNLKNAGASFNYFDGTLDAAHRVKHGDLLFAWSGTPGTSFGAHVWAGGDAALNQHIFRIDFSPALVSRDYLAMALNENVAKYVAQAQGGVGLAHITKSKFMASAIPLPPLAEQRRIADEHARHSSLGGAVDSATRAQVGRVAALRHSILAAAFSGRLHTFDLDQRTGSSIAALTARAREASA